MQTPLLIALPLAVISTAVAFLLSTYVDVSAIQAATFALALFAALVALGGLFWIAFAMKRNSRQIAEFANFENEVSRQLDRIEGRAPSARAEIESKIGEAEARIAQLEKTGQMPSEKSRHAKAESIAASEEFSDEKIVRLQPSVKTPPAKTAAKPNASEEASNNLGKRKNIADALESGGPTIRLQPIFDMLESRVIALEAHGYLLLDGTDTAIADLADTLSREQLTGIDERMMHELGRVLRAMEADGQMLPLYYRALSGHLKSNKNRERMLKTLESDSKLADALTVCLAPDLSREPDASLELALRELGVSLCLDEVTSPSDASNRLASGRFAAVRTDAATLLAFSDMSGSRFADDLLPALGRHDVSIFVKEIMTAEQASQVIDLDIIHGQGDYLSPPRPIKLYSKSGTSSHTAEDAGSQRAP